MFRTAMRVISLNVNGIRAAEKKGLSRWLAKKAGPWDVLCVQELKAGHEDIPKPMRSPLDTFAHFHPAQKKGYSGVGIWARRVPDKVFVYEWSMPPSLTHPEAVIPVGITNARPVALLSHDDRRWRWCGPCPRSPGRPRTHP